MAVYRNVPESGLEMVRSFVDYLWSDEAQEALARRHFRVASERIMRQYSHRYQQVELPFTVGYLGGWEEATSAVIDRTWRVVQREIR